MKKVLKKIFKTLISWGVIVFFGWIIYKNIGDYSTLISTVKGANFVFATWGAVLAIGNIAITTAVFKTNYSIFGKPDANMGVLLPEMVIFSFLIISNPLGYTGAGAYTIKKLAGQGYSFVQSLFAIFSIQLSTNIAFLPILATALFLLNKGNQLHEYEIGASILLLLINVILILAIAMIVVLPGFSRKMAIILAKFINAISKPFIGNRPISVNQIDSIIYVIQQSSVDFDSSIKKFGKALLLALIYHIINLAILFISFQVFNYTIEIPKLITLYAVIILFSIISPTPQGMGVVEGLAQLVAKSIGIPTEVAVVSILSYRVMTLWLPALLGLIVYSRKKNT